MTWLASPIGISILPQSGCLCVWVGLALRLCPQSSRHSPLHHGLLLVPWSQLPLVGSSVETLTWCLSTKMSGQLASHLSTSRLTEFVSRDTATMGGAPYFCHMSPTIGCPDFVTVLLPMPQHHIPSFLSAGRAGDLLYNVPWSPAMTKWNFSIATAKICQLHVPVTVLKIALIFEWCII